MKSRITNSQSEGAEGKGKQNKNEKGGVGRVISRDESTKAVYRLWMSVAHYVEDPLTSPWSTQPPRCYFHFHLLFMLSNVAPY